MQFNPLKKLESLGQSIWLDFIDRDFIASGKLKKLIREDGLRGVTSNPSIFAKAFAQTLDYDTDIAKMAQEGKEIAQIYEVLSQKDVKAAADEFRDLYHITKGLDGYVSLEVNPHLAYDTDATIAEARRLWRALNRSNVFIKVPATQEGLAAITQLISEGINVNVTLLFGLPRYREVAEAYLAGIESRIAAGKPVEHIASVASFFLSRIDVLIDSLLEKFITNKNSLSELAKACQGEVAIASAKKAYQIYEAIFSSERFKKLSEKGAKAQRLLWASTSTKNPDYSDVKYIEPLIGPNTVNTLPLETIEAYRDHGNPKVRLAFESDKAAWVFQRLPELSIDINKITQELEDEGVEKFNKSYDELIATLQQKL